MPFHLHPQRLEQLGNSLTDETNALRDDVTTHTAGNAAVTPLVSDAIAHADMLSDVAEALEAELAGARQEARDPVAAAKSFERIAAGVDEAEAALRDARDAVYNASKQVRIKHPKNKFGPPAKFFIAN